MKNILLGCAAGLLSLAANAQEESAAPEGEDAAPAQTEPAANARSALDGRYYLSPSLSWVFADSGRQTDDGQALSLAFGRAFSDALVLEAFAQYNRFDHDEGSDSADLLGIGVNSLFFPSKTAPAYLLLGAGYGDVSSHPGGEESYGALLLNVGGGWWWKPFDLGFLKGLSLRTDAVWRLDAHNDRRTGTTVRNGRKDFQDVLLSVGLNIPIGEAAVPIPPAPTEPVEVVAVETPADADGDGVVDELDQCPETPAGTAVDAQGCPAAATSVCKAPEPGEKLDLSGCASGDVIVLRGVNFDFNQDRLTPNAKTILDGVGEALSAAPTTNVELGGHTDGKGTDEYNQRLSERRACSVARYLSGRGTEEGRMTPAGYGEAKPVADNETDEGREQNRRVELKILDGAGSGLGSCSSGIFAPPAPVEPAVVESLPETAAEAAPVTAQDSGGAPAPESPAVVESEAPPPAEEPAAVSAPEPAPAPEAAAAPADSAPAASAKSMEMVPENDVFGGSPAPSASSEPAAGDSPASSANTQQLVPESEVFGDPSAPAAAPAPAASDRPTSASGPPQMVPESEVFDSPGAASQ